MRLNDTFCQNHYLAGLLQQEVRSALNQVSDVRKIALRSLRDLLTKHELDDRYQNKVSTLFLFLFCCCRITCISIQLYVLRCVKYLIKFYFLKKSVVILFVAIQGPQSRIASLYLPWIYVVVDNWNRLNVTATSMDTAATTPMCSTISSVASPSIQSAQSLSLPRNTLPPTSWKRYSFQYYPLFLIFNNVEIVEILPPVQVQ